jgi:uncharacterized protein
MRRGTLEGAADSPRHGPGSTAPRAVRLPVRGFFLISHGFSWACWIGAAAWVETSVWDSPARWLVYLGGLGPMAAGVGMTYAAAGRDGLRELWSRVIDPRRIPLHWLAIALLVPLFAMAGAVAVAAVGGAMPGAVDASQLVMRIGSPAGLVAFAFFVLIFGPVPEEIGWRGYALDALQARWSALAASLLLGAAWALWHAPLFFIPGYYADGAPPDPVLFTVAILVHSVLYTWIYNHTRRSVLAAILFHFMINFVGMLVEGVAWVEWMRTAIAAVIALIAIWYCGGQLLRRDLARQRLDAPASGIRHPERSRSSARAET